MMAAMVDQPALCSAEYIAGRFTRISRRPHAPVNWLLIDVVGRAFLKNLGTINPGARHSPRLSRLTASALRCFCRAACSPQLFTPSDLLLWLGFPVLWPGFYSMGWLLQRA